MHDATVEQRWGEVALTFVDVRIRSGLSVPVQLGGGPIATLDVYAVDPRAWDDTEVRALQASVRVVASLLGAAAKASSPAPWPSSSGSGGLQGLIERANGALMECKHLDAQEAFTHLRRAARSSGRKLAEVAREVAAGLPLPRGRTNRGRLRRL